MLKARDILRLKHEVGLSLREIGKSCGCGKTTVMEVLQRAEDAGITWPIEQLSDKQLMSMLYPPSENKKTAPEPDMEYVFREMKKKGVTLMLLWEEYKEKHPDGIMYTQFCDRYRKFKKHNDISMHIEHKAGEAMQVDWAGSTMDYMDLATKEMKLAYIFVAVLPASAYPFVYAYEDMMLANWIDAHVKAYEYFGGVPKFTIPDNTKTAVTKPDLVDPVINRSYNEMASHYGTIIIPARVYKPKDKAADENMVGNVTRRVIAPLRNLQFFSIQAINQAVKGEIAKFINRPFQKMEGNRLKAFETIDKPALQPLPLTQYEYAVWKETKVPFNYHVEYEGRFYSVHYLYVGCPCSIRATSRAIEVFIDGQRVTAHNRNINQFNRYTTLPEHMPEKHKAVAGWNDERFLSSAEEVGPYTRELVKVILESCKFSVQGYRSCIGIIRLSNEYSKEIMENSSRQALEKRTYSFKYFSTIVRHEGAKAPEATPERVVKHKNIRGSKEYAGGGLNA